MKRFVKRILFFHFIGIFPIIVNAQSVIKINGSAPRNAISPSLYGIFFEEISHGGEGGLYAEMIQNRSFEDSQIPSGCILKDSFAIAPAKPDYFTGKIKNWKQKWDIDPLSSWKLTVPSGAQAKVSVTDSIPLNSATPHAAFLKINKASEDNRVIFSNSGFWGISVKEGEKYKRR